MYLNCMIFRFTCSRPGQPVAMRSAFSQPPVDRVEIVRCVIRPVLYVLTSALQYVIAADAGVLQQVPAVLPGLVQHVADPLGGAVHGIGNADGARGQLQGVLLTQVGTPGLVDEMVTEVPDPPGDYSAAVSCWPPR